MKISTQLLTWGLMTLLYGCATDEGPSNSAGETNFRIDKISTLKPVTIRLPEEFNAQNPSNPNSGRNDALFLPRLGGNAAVVAATSVPELLQLRLVATDLVAALVQLPELNPVSVTLQVSPPKTAFGNVVVRTLEEAGYGLQRVQDDAGLNYLSYKKRVAETDAGPINDYEIAVGVVRVQREYVNNEKGIYPSSLMSVSGTRLGPDVELAEDIFVEQGGADVFISGIDLPGQDTEVPKIKEVSVNDYDETPVDRRTAQRQVFEQARRRNSLADLGNAAIDLNEFERLRRAVLIFNDNQTRLMGVGNKQAVRLLVREFEVGDVYEITACTDADGSNDSALARGIRVEEEFIGHGVPVQSLLIAPCRRADFRHPTDNSPSPVEIVHHRPLVNL
ncbi:MAG: hypothetical protein KTR35_20515 [Gammaproteobacteria bacterium]|nr:hypothetical protein [Gammaproteobacteria bacterium]